MFSFALTLLVTTAQPPATAAPTTSTLAPVSDKDYAALILGPRAGKVVVVNFWASYCLPCIEEIPALQELAREYAARADVVFVSTDPPTQGAHALSVLKRHKVEFPALRPGGPVASFIVSNEDPDPFIKMIDLEWQGEMPYTVIYNGKGAAVQKLPGGHGKAEFQAAIDKALPLPAKKP